MKNLKLFFRGVPTIVILTIFTQISVAQVKKESVYDMSRRRVFESNDIGHISDKNADKFVGTWVWKSNNDLFKIILKKYSHNWGGDKKPALIDLLTGGYRYIKNGKEIANTLDTNLITGSTEGQLNLAYLSVFNPGAQKNVAYAHTSDEYFLTYIDTSHVKLERSKRKQEGAINEHLLIPINIILTKVN